jgi:hypothetical protein
MKEFSELRERIENEIGRVSNLPKDFVSPVSEVAGEARAKIVELHNPVVMTDNHIIAVTGRVFVLSGNQLIAALKTRYSIGRASNFAKIVDDFIDKGESSGLGALSQRFDTNLVMRELRAVSEVLMANRNGLVLLRSLETIEPVNEYVIDGAHSSGKYLPAIEVPAIVKADNIELKFESDQGVRVSDGRVEKNMVAYLSQIAIIVEGIENNVREVKGGLPYLGDIVAIAGILMFAFGIMVAFGSRLRLSEFSVPVAVVGLALLVVRYGPFFPEYFSEGKKVIGDAPMKIRFYGELE